MLNFSFQIYTNCQVIRAVSAEGILHNWTLSQLDTFTTPQCWCHITGKSLNS